MSNKQIFIERVKEYHPSLLRNINNADYKKLASLKKDEDNSQWKEDKLLSMTNKQLISLKKVLDEAWVTSGYNPQKRMLLRLSKKAQIDFGIHREENY